MIILLLLLSLSLQAVEYSAQDLQELANEEEFQRFFIELYATPPTKRGKNWKELVTQTAKSYGQQLQNTPALWRQIPSFMKLAEHKTLKQDSFYLYYREKLLPLYLVSCLKSKPQSSCLKQLQESALAQKLSPESSWEIAQALYQHQQPHAQGWPYLKAALSSPAGERFCQNSWVLPLLEQELKLKLFSGSQRLQTFLSSQLPPTCKRQLVSQLETKIYAADAPLREWAYQALQFTESLKTEHKDFYHALYYLESTGNPSPELTQAWSSLQQLSSSVARRSKLLKQLKKHKALPGTLFSLPKNLSLIQQLSRSFPEYLKYYGEVCLKQRRDEDTPHIATHCSQLFTFNQAKQWVGELTYQDFKKASL